MRALGLRLRATTLHALDFSVSFYPVVARGRSRGQRSVVGRQMSMLGVLTWIDPKGGMRCAFPPYGPPGRAIELGGLYVGREQELDKIKKMLFGQTHENLGNLVGWVY